MARKAKKSSEKTTEQVANPVAESPKAPVAVDTKPSVTPKLIVAQRKFDRWYVYFQGVHPKDNVGLGCKTAKSAIRYMYLLKSRYGATISQNIYERLAHEAKCEG